MGSWKVIVNGSTKDFEDDYKFIVQHYQGAGMAPIDTISTDFGLLDGAIFQRQRVNSRTLTLVGLINGSDTNALHQNRKLLINAVKPDRSASQEAVVLQYTGGASTVTGSFFYDTGLELNTSVAFKEQIALRFLAFDPYWEKTTSTSAALTTMTTVSNANYIVQRNASGVWGALGTGMNGTVRSIVTASTGVYFVSGSFTTAGGTTASRVAQWNGTTWSSVGNGMNGIVNTLGIHPTACTLYAGGNFTTASNLAASNIAQWSGTAWALMASGTNGTVNSLTVAPDGVVYATGSFTAAGGVTSCRIAYWNGAAWSTPASGGLSSLGEALAIAGDYLYVGGRFTEAKSISSKYVARYHFSASAWSSPGTTDNSINNNVFALAAGLDGTIYAGGQFSPDDGTTSGSGIAKFNGVSWAGLGNGVTNSNVRSLKTETDGKLVVGGLFYKTGSLLLSDGVAQWNGSVWTFLDINLSSSPTVFAIHSASDGVLTLGFNNTGTASAAAITTVTNSGNSTTYPIFTASAPTSTTARLYQLVNRTTGEAIYFNLTLNQSEIVTLDLRPGKKTFTSNFRGNIISTILPSSNVSTWGLLPGANNISFFMSSGSGNAKLTWTERFWSIDV